jgi:hypothetical protein
MQLLEPEVGVDIPESNHKFKDIYEKARIACETALELNKRGMPIEVTHQDALFSQQVIKGEYKPPIDVAFTPGSAIKLGAILKEYDVEVAKSAAQLRLVATNKLIELMDDPDPKNQLRAVELIGKIADVGLFAERTEITITNKSTTELEGELVKLLNDYVDVDYKDDDGTTREQEEGTFEDEEEGEGGEDDDAGDTEGEDR